MLWQEPERGNKGIFCDKQKIIPFPLIGLELELRTGLLVGTEMYIKQGGKLKVDDKKIN
jgi:hypothetical protein